MKLKTIGLMLLFLALAFIGLVAIFYLLEIATRPDDQINLYWPSKPGYLEEVGR